MKTELTREQVSVLIRYHNARHHWLRLVELKAPHAIKLSAYKRLQTWVAGAYLLGALKYYPQLQNRLETRRIQLELEGDRKFECLHHVETVSKLPEDVQPKQICPFGGTYGSFDHCTKCPHFQQISDADRDRLEWWP